MKVNVLLLMLSIFFLLSCEREITYKSEAYIDVFEVDIPEEFSKMQFEDVDACFTYGNKLRDYYIVISKENVDELYRVGLDYSFDEYSNLKLAALKQQLTLHTINVEPLSDRAKKKNGMINRSYIVTGVNLIIGHKAYYQSSVYMSKTNFYSIITWCSFENKDKYANAMKRMHSSFKEL